MDARHPAARRRGRTLPAILVLLAAVLLAACAGAAGHRRARPDAPRAAPRRPPHDPSATASPEAAFPLTITDDEGTSVEIPAEPQQIVSLTPAATETLFALGLGDRVVGKVEDFSVYPPEAASVPDVAKFGSVDVEKIVGLGTDLVIAGGSNFNPPEAIEKLRSLGVPTVVIFAPDLETALADIELIGRAAGRPDEAASLADGIDRGAFDEVKAATADLAKPRVFYELDASSGFFGPAPDYFGAEMIELAGGDPLTSGQDGVYQIEAEKIVDFDPEVILLGDAAYGVTPEQVAARPGWDVLTAVKNGDVRPIDDVIVTRPGPRLVDGHPGARARDPSRPRAARRRRRRTAARAMTTTPVPAGAPGRLAIALRCPAARPCRVAGDRGGRLARPSSSSAGSCSGSVDLAPLTTVAILAQADPGHRPRHDLAARPPRRSSWTCACRACSRRWSSAPGSPSPARRSRACCATRSPTRTCWARRPGRRSGRRSPCSSRSASVCSSSGCSTGSRSSARCCR